MPVVPRSDDIIEIRGNCRLFNVSDLRAKRDVKYRVELKGLSNGKVDGAEYQLD
jgi:hypothetical protein